MNRQTPTPRPIARIGKTWLFPGGKRLPVVAGGDETADPDPADEQEPIELPENLTDREAVSDEDLETLEAALVAEFDRLLDEGCRDVALMTSLADKVTAVDNEQKRREAEDAEADAEIAELAKRVKGEPEPDANDDEPKGDDAKNDDEPKAEDDKQPEAEDDKQPEPQPAASKEPITAGAGAPPPRKPSARQVTKRAPAATPPPKSSTEMVAITAAAEVPGYGNNDSMTVEDVAKGLHEKARGLSDRSQRATGKVATIHRPGIKFVKDGGDPSELLDALVAGGIEQGAQGLVAAGGWCLPSQTFLEFFAIEGADAMFDLPTIGVEGGGLNVPSFIGFDGANQALWTWTEDSDQNAIAGIPLANMALTANVLTVDTTGNHELAVGDSVTINTTTAAFADLDGQTVTVASVVDANTFTANFTHANIASAAATGTVNVGKPCMRIPCPTWTEYRLEAEGLCITHGNLTDRAFPQLGRRYVQLATSAHERRMRSRAFQKVLATIDAGNKVAATDLTSDSVGETLGAVDLAVAGYKDRYAMGANDVLEAVFPLWAIPHLRSSFSRRAGFGDAADVSNADIVRWFTDRQVRPQFIRDYQPLYAGAVPTAWPGTMKFIAYPAGGYFMGTGGGIDLGAQRDSMLNKTNDFTLAWSEEFFLVGQRGPDAVEYTVTLDPRGSTACCP